MGSHLLPFVRGGCTLILFCASEMGELRGGGGKHSRIIPSYYAFYGDNILQSENMKCASNIIKMREKEKNGNMLVFKFVKVCSYQGMHQPQIMSSKCIALWRRETRRLKKISMNNHCSINHQLAIIQRDTSTWLRL